VRLPQTQTYYAQGSNKTQLQADARLAARQAGFETNNFNLDIVAFSYTSNIGWLGLAGVGGKGNLLNGAFFFQEAAHELGHNYGLLHANLWRSTDGNPIGQGSNVEYGDCYDDMGACVNQSMNSHFNTRYKRLLDWLTDANVQTVTSNGTYRIFAQDSISAGGFRTLKIQKDSTKNYWIEFRQLFQSASDGALIRWDYASQNFLETQLLDMNPNTASAYDSALLIGQSFYDSTSQIRITVMGKGNTTPESLDVKVEFGQSPGGCAFSLSPTNTTIDASGGSGGINITAGTGCAWTATSNSSWITITGGSNGTGNGTASFTVQPNTNSSRTGTITIAGQIFTVNQTAAAPSYEADVDPSPSGNQSMQSGDVLQMRLFLNCTGTQPDSATNEFQRADSSPFDPATGTYGDGKIQSDDIVQTRRYANMSDAGRPAAGPTAPIAPRCGSQPPPVANGQQN